MSAWYHQEGCVYVHMFVRIEMCFVGGCHHASTYLWPGFHLFLPQLSLWQLRKHTSEKRECDFPKITLMTNGRVRPGLRRSVMRPAACWPTKWGAFCDIFWNWPLFNGVMGLAEATLVMEWLSHENVGSCVDDSFTACMAEMFWEHSLRSAPLFSKFPAVLILPSNN